MEAFNVSKKRCLAFTYSTDCKFIIKNFTELLYVIVCFDVLITPYDELQWNNSTTLIEHTSPVTW